MGAHYPLFLQRESQGGLLKGAGRLQRGVTYVSVVLSMRAFKVLAVVTDLTKPDANHPNDEQDNRYQ
jgi:hypothetical protein